MLLSLIDCIHWWWARGNLLNSLHACTPYLCTFFLNWFLLNNKNNKKKPIDCGQCPRPAPPPPLGPPTWSFLGSSNNQPRPSSLLALPLSLVFLYPPSTSTIQIHRQTVFFWSTWFHPRVQTDGLLSTYLFTLICLSWTNRGQKRLFVLLHFEKRIQWWILVTIISEPAESSRPALKTARFNANQTRPTTTMATTTSGSPSSSSQTVVTRTSNGGKTWKGDCQCRPEEFTCSSWSSSGASSSPNNNSRRKGQLSFTVKVYPFYPFCWRLLSM